MTGERSASYPAPPGRHATSTDTDSTRSVAEEAPTVVAPGTSVEGDVQGPGGLVVKGSLRGRASMGGTVRIEAGSSVQADIRAPRVVIVDGASFQGEVDTSGAEPPDAPGADGGTGSPGDDLSALRRRIRLRGA